MKFFRATKRLLISLILLLTMCFFGEICFLQSFISLRNHVDCLKISEMINERRFPGHIYDNNKIFVDNILSCLKRMKVRKVNYFSKEDTFINVSDFGSSLKFLIELEQNQTVVFKPKW